MSKSNLSDVLRDLNRYEQLQIKAMTVGVSKVMDKIGIDSKKKMIKANVYTISTKKKRKSFVKNPTNNLRVQSGNLKRSLLGTSSDKIREITIDTKNAVVSAKFGSSVSSNRGFGYAKFHEFTSRFRGFLSDAVNVNRNRYSQIVAKEMDKVKK